MIRVNFDNIGRSGFRLIFLGFVFLIAFVIIFYKLWRIQIVERHIWASRALEQYQSVKQIKGIRGEIVDRNSRNLAISVPSISLGANPHMVGNIAKLAYRVVGIIPELKIEKLKAQLSTEKSFVWLARDLNDRYAEPLKKLGNRGLQIIREFVRTWPQGDLASPLLGYVGRDGKGLSGVELYAEKQLAGGSEILQIMRDGKQRSIGIKKGQKNQGADILFRRKGNQIKLTIDLTIQSILEEEIEIGKIEAKAKRVFAVMTDAYSGEILAMSQADRFDPNSSYGVTSSSMKNYPLQNAFEPGSTFKPLVAALILTEKKVSDRELINCENGRFKIGKHEIKDVHVSKELSIRDVIIRSSNICMAKLGMRLGAQGLREGFISLGFGKPTGIKLPGEALGLVRKKKNWKKIDTATSSFGHGISVTALQMVQAYSAIVNNGEMVSLKLLMDSKKVSHQVLSPSSVKIIESALEGVVSDAHGTAKLAAIEEVKVYGKTGTAQKARKNSRGYDPNVVISSFIGYVRLRKPSSEKAFLLYVIVDEPKVYPRWGGKIAAPIFKRIMERVLAYERVI